MTKVDPYCGSSVVLLCSVSVLVIYFDCVKRKDRCHILPLPPQEDVFSTAATFFRPQGDRCGEVRLYLVSRVSIPLINRVRGPSLKLMGKKGGFVTLTWPRIRGKWVVNYISEEFGNDFHSRGTASNFWSMSTAKQVQFEMVFKSLAGFNTQFKVQESFELLLTINVKAAAH